MGFQVTEDQVRNKARLNLIVYLGSCLAIPGRDASAGHPEATVYFGDRSGGILYDSMVKDYI